MKLSVFFCGITSFRNQITKRQLSFIGKVFHIHDSQILTQIITAWCNHPQKWGRVLQTNKKNITKNLQIIIPSAEKDGRLLSCAYCALEKSYWDSLLSQLKNKPSEWDGATPHPDDYTHPLHPSTPPCALTSPPQRQHNNTYSLSNSRRSPPPLLPTPPRKPPPPPCQSNRSEWNYNPDGVGRNIIDSFGILQLSNTDTER